MSANKDREEFLTHVDRFAVGWGNTYVRPGEMTHRERFLNCMNFKKIDRMTDMSLGFWAETIKRWHNEGLPDYVNSSNALFYFGFDEWRRRIPISVGLNPGYKEEIISDNGEYKIYYDNLRVKRRAYSGSTTMPQFLEYPVKTRADYVKLFKGRLNPDADPRVNMPEFKLREQADIINRRNYVLVSLAGSVAGWIRNWMGFEGYCYGIHDQPELIEEMTEDLGAVFCSVAEEIGKYVKIDLLRWWEDIAFKTGPIVPPDFFERVCGKVLKETMDIYRRSGASFAYVDSDGDCRALIPTWLRSGIKILSPLEIAAHMDPLNLRKSYPGIRMMGGFDKRILLRDKSDIKKELKRLKPIVDEGGYILHVDHSIPPDVSFENYCYFLRTKRDLFEIPNHIWGDCKGV